MKKYNFIALQYVERDSCYVWKNPSKRKLPKLIFVVFSFTKGNMCYRTNDIKQFRFETKTTDTNNGGYFLFCYRYTVLQHKAMEINACITIFVKT